MNTKEKAKDLWVKLTPKKRRNLIVGALILVILAGSLIVYEMKGGRREVKKEYVKRELGLDSDILEKSAYLEGRKRLQGLEKELEEIQRVIKNIDEAKTKGGIVPNPKPASDNVFSAQQIPAETRRFPPPPKKQQPKPALGEKELPEPVETVQIIGEIGMTTNTKDISKADTTEKKRAMSQVFLPPSFMEATLLSGLDAPTTTNAKGNPVPVLLRIKDLAFLPNRVRANLKGCFVIAEGHGNLADERAHLRLVTLSCLSKKGKAVIDAKIKGFVVDTDGRIGLRGRVVSKMGATIARAMLAGFFGGLGEAMEDQTQDVAISPLGETRSYDTSKVFEAGIGRGISRGAEELQKFYLDLARQTMPVIEVGATRKITVVVSEGTELKIRELKNAT